MKSLVQIAFDNVQSFDLSDEQKDELIKKLQGDEIEVVKRKARSKLKKVDEWAEFDKRMFDMLVGPNLHFKSRNGVNLR